VCNFWISVCLLGICPKCVRGGHDLAQKQKAKELGKGVSMLDFLIGELTNLKSDLVHISKITEIPYISTHPK